MTHLRHYASGRGFTLVEVMVTLFIIGIGALGVAGLQLAAMRSNQSAFQRSQATLAAYALVDRMRAEPSAFAHSDVLYPMNTTDTVAGGSPAETSFSAWARELEALPLKAPTGQDQHLGELDCSSLNACNNGHCRIVIRWDDSRGEDDDLSPTGRDARATSFVLCARLPQ